MESHRHREPVDDLQPVVDCGQIVALQQHVRSVAVNEAIRGYLLDIVEATRTSEELHVGASTRGALCLYRASQALALVESRDYVIPDDVKRLAVPVLSHRVITRGYMHSGQRTSAEAIIERLVDDVPVPG